VRGREHKQARILRAVRSDCVDHLPPSLRRYDRPRLALLYIRMSRAHHASAGASQRQQLRLPIGARYDGLAFVGPRPSAFDRCSTHGLRWAVDLRNIGSALSAVPRSQPGCNSIQCQGEDLILLEMESPGLFCAGQPSIHLSTRGCRKGHGAERVRLALNRDAAGTSFSTMTPSRFPCRAPRWLPSASRDRRDINRGKEPASASSSIRFTSCWSLADAKKAR